MFKLTCVECQCQDFTVTYDNNRNLKATCSNCGKGSDAKLELAQLIKPYVPTWPGYGIGDITCQSGGADGN